MDCMAEREILMNSSNLRPSFSSQRIISSRLAPAAKDLWGNFFRTDWTDRSDRCLDGVTNAQATIKPVNSSQQNKDHCIWVFGNLPSWNQPWDSMPSNNSLSVSPK